ncbi:MAG TPA: ferrous iron transport protein B [Cyclobacteriaceae bacterium]|nr:ferrous iron transport protein B [Cyclobacteriaceae bacterium]
MTKQPFDFKIALAGNPNSGKSTLFNLLTGLNQKVGNFPGVTVDKKSGFIKFEEKRLELIDLPGIYSINPRTEDERIVVDILSNKSNESFPDKVLVVADASNLMRSLLLLTQIIDLGLPAILVLNMIDLSRKAGIQYDLQVLKESFGVPVVAVNSRTAEGIAELKSMLISNLAKSDKSFFQPNEATQQVLSKLKSQIDFISDYQLYQLMQQADKLEYLSASQKEILTAAKEALPKEAMRWQHEETLKRYESINEIIAKATLLNQTLAWKNVTAKLDAVITHKIWGYLIFLSILFLVFQSIFAWATIPMDFIDATFSNLSNYLSDTLPEGALSSLLADGVVPGIGGIAIFIPQIAILFAFIAILEESGYMSRVVFLMDKIMRKFGLNGKSVVPLLSGVACAVPAIMATRNIENWKDRLITIMVTPLMSCSARLPVYTIIISLVVPAKIYLGLINLQGIALMGMYLLGFVAALFSAFVMKLIIKTRDKGFLIMELPTYKWPKWSNVGFIILEKSKTFVFEAGKIILAISILLWVLASYGPSNRMDEAEEAITSALSETEINSTAVQNQIAAVRLENSYAGIMGKQLEPLIRPLGYDWKIGIALITSFAAREVFVGTMATIYSLGDTDDESTIKSRMRTEINPETGGPRFTPAVGFSLLVFYAFAMQCMSTIAVVFRETKGWKWPMIQLAYMTLLAYLAALLVYQILS